MISSGLKVALVLESDLPALLVQRVARIRSSKPGLSRFIFQCLKHPSFWNYCNPTETTIPHISPVELKNYPMIKPPDDLVERFCKIAINHSSINGRFERDLELSEHLFGSLSQRAFSGGL